MADLSGFDRDRVTAAYESARRDLLAARADAGHWIGRLSTSALSTATAVSALTLTDRACGQSTHAQLVRQGIDWLAAHQNSDGGWGDTDRSHSNIATTMLVRAAFQLAGRSEEFAELLTQAVAHIDRHGAIDGLRRRYGRDKTFAVPILTNCALAGLADWRDVSPLPFELACLPQSWYRFARLPVVSYAVPALVAIGQARFHHAPPWNPLLRFVRRLAVPRSLRVLSQMQPDSGGYLEAAPLTSFVVMSLASIGRATSDVAQRGVRFLVDSVRPDGSWPIDTNLATWNTTLAINALAARGDDVLRLLDVPGEHGSDGAAERAPTGRLLDWLLGCQFRERHPFTGADPGGWGWSDLSGAVPDADDTPGALLALRAWHDAPRCPAADRARIVAAVERGLRWLVELQNRDGGWPTFCRGWGKLPFDRSGADLTAHAVRALGAWRDLPIAGVRADRSERARQRGYQYLQRVQQADGSWVPLWFGNQDHPREENPVYGTAKVLVAYGETGQAAAEPARRAIRWLCDAQRADGSWGSVEESALAVEALAAVGQPANSPTLARALDWLAANVETRRHLESCPIGFYFARLWYYEQLYPLTFTVAALGRVLRYSA